MLWHLSILKVLRDQRYICLNFFMVFHYFADDSQRSVTNQKLEQNH